MFFVSGTAPGSPSRGSGLFFGISTDRVGGRTPPPPTKPICSNTCTRLRAPSQLAGLDPLSRFGGREEGMGALGATKGPAGAGFGGLDHRHLRAHPPCRRREGSLGSGGNLSQPKTGNRKPEPNGQPRKNTAPTSVISYVLWFGDHDLLLSQSARNSDRCGSLGPPGIWTPRGSNPPLPCPRQGCRADVIGVGIGGKGALPPQANGFWGLGWGGGLVVGFGGGRVGRCGMGRKYPASKNARGWVGRWVEPMPALAHHEGGWSGEGTANASGVKKSDGPVTSSEHAACCCSLTSATGFHFLPINMCISSTRIPVRLSPGRRGVARPRGVPRRDWRLWGHAPQGPSSSTDGGGPLLPDGGSNSGFEPHRFFFKLDLFFEKYRMIFLWVLKGEWPSNDLSALLRKEGCVVFFLLQKNLDMSANSSRKKETSESSSNNYFF